MPESYSIVFGETLAAGCHFSPPDWSPSAGEIKQISHAAGYFGTNGGAILDEINPKYQAWNPDAPNEGRFAAGGYYWGSILSYSGICWNADTRQLVNYGAGHAAPNVCAPFCFDLNDLRYKWLDTPLPWTGYLGMSSPPTQAQLDAAFPNGELDYAWGELQGDSAGWPEGYDRPGIIQPIPSHTRGNLVHITASIMGNTKGGMFTYGAYTGVLSGTESDGSHIFDFDSATWRRTTNRRPSLPSTYGYSPSGSAAVCDVETGTMIHFGGGKYFRVFDFEMDSWSLKTSTNNFMGSTDGGSVVNHLPSGLLIYPFARDAGGVETSNGVKFAFGAVAKSELLSGSAFSISTLTVSGDAWPLKANGYNTGIGWSYCPADKCLYAINGQGGSNKYWKLSPPAGATTQDDYLTGTWTLTEHAFSSGTLSSASSQSMVYNRLSWDRSSRSFLWFSDSVTGPVQAFRPSGV